MKYAQIKEEMVKTWENNYLRQMIAAYNWNVSRAAKAAGLDRSNLLRLLRKYDIKRPSSMN